MNKFTLELYYFDSCPYCQLVLSVIHSLNLKVKFNDISKDSSSLNKLVSDTGKRTVPCLYINGKPMFESRDIANWLKSNESQLEKN